MWSGDMICGVETGYVMWGQDMWCGDRICALGTWYMLFGHGICFMGMELVFLWDIGILDNRD